MTDYQLCGWRVRSDIPLSCLPPWVGDDRNPDLSICLGVVPQRLEDPVYEAPLFQLGRDGRCRFEIAKVAAYLVDAAGREVVVTPAINPNAPDMGVFLLNTVLAIVCHHRGLLPLHASCVRIGNKAIAFIGASALGKSVLAALFYRQRHIVLADDVTVVDRDAMVLPAPPYLALWRDDLERLGYNPEGLERRRAGLEKYHLPLTNQSITTQSIPLTAIYHLGEARDPRHEKRELVRGYNAGIAINVAVLAAQIGRLLRGRKVLFADMAKLAASVPAYILKRPLSMERNQALVAELAALYTDSGPGKECRK